MAGPSTSSSSLASNVSFGSFIQQLRPKVFTLEFLWYISHLSTILNAVLYQVTLLFSAGSSLKYYNYALLSIITTYSIVLFQVFKASKLNLLNPRVLIRNDNFQYLSLAVVWYLFSNRWILSVGLFPFFIYSVFHSLNYFKNYILPVLPSLSGPAKDKLSTSINYFIIQFNEKSLVAASNLEIMVLGQQFIDVLFTVFKLFRLNFIDFFIKAFITLQYISFLKSRYHQSKHTQLLIDGYIYRVDTFFNSGRVPHNLVAQYHVLKQKAQGFLSFFPN